MADQYVLIRYSKDGGHKWSNWKQRDLGDIGQYQKRVRVMNLGRFRNVVFEISVSGARRRDLMAAYAAVEPLDA